MSSATTRYIQGCVTNALNSSPIKDAKVTVNTLQVAATDDVGLFAVEAKAGDTIRIEVDSYEQKQLMVKGNEPVLIHFALMPLNVSLDEVVVRAGKYSKKDNPAVALAKQLIKRRDEGKLEKLDSYSRTRSRRVAYGLNNFSARDDNHVLNSFPFLAQYADTVTIDNQPRPVLPISVTNTLVSEQGGTTVARRDSTLSSSHAGLDESFDINGIQAFLNKMIGEVDIFQNDVPFMNNRFVSPLSTIGTTYYKYFLGDTVVVDRDSCVQLSFTPFTPQAMGFNGTLYVTTDSTLFVKRVELSLPKSINLNFTGDMSLTQTFDKALHGTRLPKDEEMIVEFQIFKNAQTLYAQQNTIYSDYHFNGASQSFSTDGMSLEHFTNVNNMQNMLDQLRSNRRFYWSEYAIKAMAKGYVPTAAREQDSYVDVGPIFSIFSSNKLEGFRTRIGGRTTTRLSPHLFLNGYVAMGWKDHKLKYQARAVYSFTPKQQFIEEYPIRALTLLHQYDTHLLGHDFISSQADNILFSISRAPDDKRLYRRLTMLSYKHELIPNFIVDLSVTHNNYEGTEFVPFVDGNGVQMERYKMWQMGISLRYSPGEKYIISYEGRSQVTDDAPIFTLTHIFTPRNSKLGTRLSNRTELAFQKRMWLSAAGYLDVIVKATKQWNKVHYLDLIIPNANLTYNIQPESFALMNVMEFINDQQLHWDVTYQLNGAIFNRIPLLKKLRLREVVSFRGIWGSLKDENNPDLNPDLLRLPPEIVYQSMGKKPYMEMSVGIGNILRILRLDYVWRLTYRDTPGVDRRGVRFQLHFSF
jgi:hypothetical protein